MFKQNSHSDRQIHHVLHLPCRKATPREELTSMAFLTFVACISNRISRVLTRCNIKTVGLPSTKVASFLQPIKDDPGL
jgi:hypothetical protein